MQDFALSIVIWNVIAALLALSIQVFRIAKVNWRWLLLGLAVFSIHVFFSRYDLISLFGHQISPVAQRMNLDGKFLGLVIALIAIVLACKSSSHINRQNLGLTLKQNEGSLVPSLLMSVGVIGVAVALHIVMGKAGSDAASSFELISYPILAGLDEELIYRGLLMTLFVLAFNGRSVRFFGADLTYGGMLALVLYAVIHGVRIDNGGLSLAVFGVGLTFFYGAVFLWVRERSGSLLLPVLAHNLVNTVGWILP